MKLLILVSILISAAVWADESRPIKEESQATKSAAELREEEERADRQDWLDSKLAEIERFEQITENAAQ